MMKKKYQSYKIHSKNIHQLPVYRKALEIFKLSRQIVVQLSGDKSVMELANSNEGSKEHFYDHLVMASLGLAPKIAMAESTPDPRVKLNSVRAIKKATSALLHYSERLEAAHIQVKDKEFLRVLKLEIKKFKRLQRHWANHLSGVN